MNQCERYELLISLSIDSQFSQEVLYIFPSNGDPCMSLLGFSLLPSFSEVYNQSID